MASGGSGTLNYRIFHCSSQDPSFPVGELINMSKDQTQLIGWQSQRFCVFPQEIVLQFPCMVHLKQVQFLVHQNKIPSRIELFAYAPEMSGGGFMSPHNANITFTRLGHFSLDDNIRTNYQARELKTVYLEQFCQYLKIVLHKNHLNNLNIFNQVGLIQINCTGTYIGDYEQQALAQQQQRTQLGASGVQEGPSASGGSGLMPRNMRIAGVNDDELDLTIQDKIRVLNQAKLKAVEEEDFDKAKHLKDAIDKLKMAGSQLVQLEVQKKLAIENEDFDSAKVLKFEIERLRNMAMNLDTERVILAPIHQQSFQSQQHQQHAAANHYIQEAEDDQQRMMMTMGSEEHHQQQYQQDPHHQQAFYSLEESKISQQHDQRMSYQPPPHTRNDELHQSMRQENPLNNSQRQMLQHLSSQQIGPRDQQSLVAQSLIQSKNSMKSHSNEEQVVPALGMKKPIDFNTVGDDDFDTGSKEEVSASQEELSLSNLPQSQRPIADAMVPLFGEKVACLVFAKAWGNRERGIQEVISHLDHCMQRDHEIPANNTILQVMVECLKDKVQQVATKAFALVEAYISSLQKHKNVNPKSDSSEKMLIHLLDRLADPKFSKRAETCFLQLFHVEQFDGTYLISFILKESSYINKNMATSFKHAVPRLQIINTILAEFPKYENDLKKTSQSTFPFVVVLNKIKEGVDASNPEHRKICLQLIVTLYTQFGFKRVEILIGELPLKHLEVLAKDIPEADAYAKARKHQPTKKE